MLSILLFCIVSAIMSLGVNIQWGYAGLFNAGIMGFTRWGAYSRIGTYIRLRGLGAAGLAVGVFASMLISILIGVVALRILSKGNNRFGLLVCRIRRFFCLALVLFSGNATD